MNFVETSPEADVLTLQVVDLQLEFGRTHRLVAGKGSQFLNIALRAHLGSVGILIEVPSPTASNQLRFLFVHLRVTTC